MSDALHAQGTILERGDGASPEVWTPIAEVKDISGPGFQLNLYDATHHQSPGKFMESIAGLRTSGEVTFTIHYLPTHDTQDGTVGLLADLKNGTRRNYRLSFPDSPSTRFIFAAFVTNFEPQAPVDGILTADVTLGVTGQPTLV